MGFETLSHTPEFELPPNGPGAPADLISLIEECYQGLAKCIVSKMLRRNKYDQVAVVICQDNPSKKTMPSATAEDIADYCMMCMQYDIDKTDDPGTYLVKLIGPPGRGRFERSKHIDLGDGDGMARTKTMMSEGELIEQQSQYIGELHAQSIAVLETLHGMVKPLLQENKEQMKIISESARRLAEVERDRMKFDLEMRIHNDEIKMEEAKEEMKNQRWRETMEVVKESGMVEGLMKAVVKKMNESKSDSSSSGGSEEKPPAKKKNYFAPSIKDEEEARPAAKKKKKNKTIVEKAKGKKKKKKKKAPKPEISEETKSAIEAGDEMTEEQLEEVFEASGLDKARENPIALMVEILKMSIEEKEQWPLIEETLSENQLVLFKDIMETDNDEEIERKLKSPLRDEGCAAIHEVGAEARRAAARLRREAPRDRHGQLNFRKCPNLAKFILPAGRARLDFLTGI